MNYGIGNVKAGGGGKQLYRHNIVYYYMADSFSILLTIISDKSTSYSANEFLDYIKASPKMFIKANGFKWTSGDQWIIDSILYDNVNLLYKIHGLRNNTSVTIANYTNFASGTVETYTPIAL